MTRARPPVRRVALTLGLAGAMLPALLATADASSHREAPLITEDPVVDNTDVYAFVSPDQPDTVTLAANWIPFEEPAGGPNFYKFGDDVLYTINVDNNGDAVDDVVYEFRFTTQILNPDTFLYNTGPITSLDDPDFNIRQTYSVSRVKNGKRTVLANDVPTPPVNVGPRSTPDYFALAQSAIRDLPGGAKVFAGQRDDPFYVDLGSAFDLLGLRPFNEAHAIPLPKADGVDAVSGYNVHTIALQVPKSELVREGDPVIGVYSSTYRRKSRVFEEGGAKLVHSGPFVQVSRLGMPLVNEVIIPLGKKDRFNSSKPADDAQFGSFVLDPEPARLIPALYPGVEVPPAPRNDLATIFLTGIPGVNQPKSVTPSEMIRLNTSVAPTERGNRNRLGLLSGRCDLATLTGPDCDGFPNGRRLQDDVVDIELRALAGATPLTPSFDRAPNNLLEDGVFPNDRGFLPNFPYLRTPWDGYSHPHAHEQGMEG